MFVLLFYLNNESFKYIVNSYFYVPREEKQLLLRVIFELKFKYDMQYMTK